MRKLVSQERVNADPRLVELQKNGWTIYDVEGAIMPEATAGVNFGFGDQHTLNVIEANR